MAKQMKVYKVGTGSVENGEDIVNNMSFTVTATNAEEAIRKVKKGFNIGKRGYIESVELVTVLDE